MTIPDKNALLIINPVAGRKQIQRYVVQIVRSLMDKGYLVTTMVTAGRTDARDWTARFGADFDLVVCAGGDGTLNECASGMAEADLSIPLGYIPCGSTNDFAAAHGLSTDIPGEAERIAGGNDTSCITPCSEPLPGWRIPPIRSKRTCWATEPMFWMR